MTPIPDLKENQHPYRLTQRPCVTFCGTHQFTLLYLTKLWATWRWPPCCNVTEPFSPHSLILLGKPSQLPWPWSSTLLHTIVVHHVCHTLLSSPVLILPLGDHLSVSAIGNKFHDGIWAPLFPWSLKIIIFQWTDTYINLKCPYYLTV